jgi:hypothetical protein
MCGKVVWWRPLKELRKYRAFKKELRKRRAFKKGYGNIGYSKKSQQAFLLHVYFIFFIYCFHIESLGPLVGEN